MKHTVTVGMKKKVNAQVTDKDTAIAFGSGLVNVMATPKMIALMENAAYKAAASGLPEGYTTVGTHMDATHTAPTPVGMEVYATAKVTDVDGKKLTFSVKAYDQDGLIGKGTHTRFIVQQKKFDDRAKGKLPN